MPDRTRPPAVHSLSRFTLPPAAKHLLPNGVPLFGLTGVQQEVIKIDWVFSASRWQENQPGSAHLLALMLDKGTEKFSAAQLAAAFEGLGAHIEITSGADHFYVSLYALSKNWPDAIPIIDDIFSRPCFPEKELSLQKNITIENLRVSREKTSYLASQHLRAVLFGAQHPYGASLHEEQITNLQPDHLRDFHQTHFALASVFAVVPTESDLQQIISLTGHMGSVHPAASRAIAVTPGGTHHSLPKEGSVQSSIRLGKRTIGRSHPDYGALVLVNHLLGGFFGSRLMKNIREQKGLTYGIHSSLQPFLFDASLVISAEVNRDNQALALTEINREVERMCTEPVADAELDTARNHFLGSFLADMATPFSVMEKIKTVSLHALPPDYYNHLFRQIEEVTPAQLCEVAGRHLAAGWHEVTVG